MGAAGLLAVYAGRPASRLYALLLAAAVTLGLNPRSSGDVGWQLSFAAVAGIFLLAAPVRDAILGARLGSSPIRRALAEGTALTFAATLATAPLTAHHFGALPVTTLAANLAALPAVAPAMWLGMIVAALGQLPWAPLAPLNWLNERLLAYVAEVASTFASPDWAVAEVRLGSPLAVGAAYAALLALTFAGLKLVAALRAARAGRRGYPGRARPRGLPLAASLLAAVLIAVAVAFAGGAGRRPTREAPDGHLRVAILDVGQGDAILLQPPGAPPLLVDTGPPGAGVADSLGDLGVRSLAAVVLTHDQSDHAGGLAEIADRLPVGRFLYARAGARARAAAMAAGAAAQRLARGDVVRVAGLRLAVLWPPPEVARRRGRVEDPNLASLVLLARWRRFEMLLTGDAEAEAVPLDPGPIDLLKVSHHGSEDGGLPALLHRSRPRLAVISVGAGNPFGHPHPATLAALRRAGVGLLRTDRAGTVVIEVGGGAMRAAGTGG
jgi:competence protein ComEC